jgi:FtsZ-interacting cell division protein YlmF
MYHHKASKILFVLPNPFDEQHTIHDNIKEDTIVEAG